MLALGSIQLSNKPLLKSEFNIFLDFYLFEETKKIYIYSPTCLKQAAKGNTKIACLRMFAANEKVFKLFF